MAGGSGPGNKRVKNQEMASRMKAMGIERRTGRCPLCHKIVSNGGLHPIGECKKKGKEFRDRSFE